MSGEFDLSKPGSIELENFSTKWIPFLNFFNSDVPAFPLHRIHFRHNSERIFGAPVTKNIKQRNGDGTCTLEVKVISNRNLKDLPVEARERFVTELKERFGFSKKLSMEDILDSCSCSGGCSCKKHKQWKKLVRLIFPRLKKYYGRYIPYGRFYSKAYGALNMASTWNVPGGGKQELIMTSNLLKTVGRETTSTDEGMQVNLRLIPTYREILEGRLGDFPKFANLKEAIEDYGDRHLTHEYRVSEDIVMNLLDKDKGVPGGRSGKENWRNLISEVEKPTEKLLTQLKEDLNRMYQRPFVLIVYLYNMFQGLDFDKFEREDYVRIYREEPRTLYPKVLAMILQQVAGNFDVIPVDTWVKTFFKYLLDTSPSEIPQSGRKLGKFERFVWNASQLRKTNQPLFDEIIHCIKTGILLSENMHMRRPNPLSCHLCKLSEEGCPVYERKKSGKVAVIDRETVDTKDDDGILLETPAKKIENYDDELYLKKNFFEFGELQSIDYIVLSRNGEAEACYMPARKDKEKWKRTDDMSPFTTDISIEEGITDVESISNPDT